MKLSNGMTVLICECHEHLVKDKTWHFDGRYAIAHINKKKVYMHRLVCEGAEIDHINRDKLDNRCSNLRAVTRAENIINAPVRKDNKSGHKGITLLPNGRYRTRALGQYVGIFGSLEAAKKARMEAMT